MIWGDLIHWEQEKAAYHPILQKAVDYLTEMDLSQAEVGTYPILGEDMYAMVQQAVTEPRAERKSECHRDFIDVQYLVEGKEELYYVARQASGNVIVLDQLAEKDCAFYDKVEDEQVLSLKPGMFAVFFPNDLHCPICCRDESETIKKVVIKIHKKLLGL